MPLSDIFPALLKQKNTKNEHDKKNAFGARYDNPQTRMGAFHQCAFELSSIASQYSFAH